MSQQSVHLIAGLGLLALAWWHGIELFIAWYSGVEWQVSASGRWTLAAISVMLAAAALPLLWSAAR